MYLWIQVMRGEVSYVQVYERVESIRKDKPDHYSTSEMLISLYFPELLEKFRTLRSAADRVTEIQLRFKSSYDRTESVIEFADPFLKSLKEFHRVTVEFKESIREHGRKLALL